MAYPLVLLKQYIYTMHLLYTMAETILRKRHLIDTLLKSVLGTLPCAFGITAVMQNKTTCTQRSLKAA